MPPHQRCHGGLVPLVDEAAQQLPIRQPGLVLPKEGAAKVPDNLVDLGRHRVPFWVDNIRPFFILTVPERG
jgi:hypothetical protein